MRIAWFCFLLGCTPQLSPRATSPDDPTRDLGGGPFDLAGGVPADLASASGTYPPGPYGMRIGETLADFSAMGYRLTPAQTDSTKLTFENIKLSDYLTKSCSCLAITIGARWCGACQQEQPALKTVVSQHSDLCV